MRAHRFRFWLPAVAWAGLILSLSGEGGSSGQTERWLVRLFNPSPETLFYINYSVRKGAHVAGYAILAALNLRAIRAGRREWRNLWGAGAVLLALAVAIADEGRQASVATRTAALADIGFDLCGASLAVMALRRRGSE